MARDRLVKLSGQQPCSKSLNRLFKLAGEQAIAKVFANPPRITVAVYDRSGGFDEALAVEASEDFQVSIERCCVSLENQMRQTA